MPTIAHIILMLSTKSDFVITFSYHLIKAKCDLQVIPLYALCKMEMFLPNISL